MSEKQKELHPELKRTLEHSREYQSKLSEIADCVSGAGNFEDLKRLQAEKAELEQKAYFDTVSSIRTEISALQAERMASRETVADLEREKQELSLDEDIINLRLQSIREQHAQRNAELYIQRLADDSARKSIFEKQNTLESLIKSQMERINL